MNKPHIKAVIADWAGTIVDFGCMAPAAVFVEVFKKEGVEISIADARGPMGMNKRDHIREIGLLPHVEKAWKAQFGKAISPEDIERMYQAFIPLQLECIADYSNLIPGTKEVAAWCKAEKIKIGSTTGYNTEMLELVLKQCQKEGFEPDSYVTGDDVPAGRPAPWMAIKSAMDMGVYPMAHIVKVGDTVPDILEGVHAGMWSVGVTTSGNEVGLSLEESQTIARAELTQRIDAAAEKLSAAGAHYIIDTIADLPQVIKDINQRLAHGERP